MQESLSQKKNRRGREWSGVWSAPLLRHPRRELVQHCQSNRKRHHCEQRCRVAGNLWRQHAQRRQKQHREQRPGRHAGERFVHRRDRDRDRVSAVPVEHPHPHRRDRNLPRNVLPELTDVIRPKSNPPRDLHTFVVKQTHPKCRPTEVRKQIQQARREQQLAANRERHRRHLLEDLREVRDDAHNDEDRQNDLDRQHPFLSRYAVGHEPDSTRVWGDAKQRTRVVTYQLA